MMWDHLPLDELHAIRSRAELLARAAPPCHECGEAVQRVEMTMRSNGDGDWVPEMSYMVCMDGHRVLVEPLGPYEPLDES